MLLIHTQGESQTESVGRLAVSDSFRPHGL